MVTGLAPGRSLVLFSYPNLVQSLTSLSVDCLGYEPNNALPS
jgi:hypothetical protein